jgi:hypothetical protein
MVPLVMSLGVVAVVIGLGVIAFGVPIKEFGLGNALIMAGTTAASAGMVVLALAAVLRALERLHDTLTASHAATSYLEEASPGGSRTAPSFEPPPPAPAPGEWQQAAPPPSLRSDDAPPPERSGSPRPARSSWSTRPADEAGRQEPPAPAPRAPAPALRAERDQAALPRTQPRADRPREPLLKAPPLGAERRRERADASGAADGADEYAPPPAGSPERRRMFGWTRRSVARRASAEAAGEQPGEPGPDETNEPPALEFRAARREEESREPPRSPAGRQPAARRLQQDPGGAVEVLKTGTVDGMSYTLYTDGSIDAEFKEGKIRFASIEDLRRHLEEQG